jgi:hypothetical protein
MFKIHILQNVEKAYFPDVEKYVFFPGVEIPFILGSESNLKKILHL